MVFFTCNGCGESLKKAQVDKHVSICRSCQVLSCIDCGKDFWGDDYKDHVKCISEDQKYGGKNYEAKANKGDVKQQQWIQRVHDAINKPGINPGLKNVLKQVSAYDNVPRKKSKFENWMRNSLKISNSGLHQQVWDILNTATESSPDAQKTPAAEVKTSPNGDEKQVCDPPVEKKKLNKRERKEARQLKNGKVPKVKAVSEDPEEDQPVHKKKDRKRKRSAADDENEENECNGDAGTIKKAKADDLVADDSDDAPAAPKGKFNWKGNIKAVLREAPDQELSLKKLRKKVLAAYYSYTGDGNFKSEEEILALFNKKINKNPKFRLLKEKVKLVN
ncbi:cell growth-regulating nucleolar protein isoform X1 [Synchiropus splendidus]|uniref:cell growth-regulating nucleolar protein isoform X1 n=1 Tax=Synchiropus splendidus TaxID=270530 RepID=UPI00237D93E2|nr:cell growth-regulating nucleolar protein isoform X1 [Synchiropus splendidus]